MTMFKFNASIASIYNCFMVKSIQWSTIFYHWLEILPMQNTSKLLIFVLIYPTLINTQLSPILTTEYLITSIKKKKRHYQSFGHLPKHINFLWHPTSFSKNMQKPLVCMKSMKQIQHNHGYFLNYFPQQWLPYSHLPLTFVRRRV